MDKAEKTLKKAACASELLDVLSRHDPAIGISAMIDVMVAFVVLITNDREDLAWEGLGVIEKDLRNSFAVQLETVKRLSASGGHHGG